MDQNRVSTIAGILASAVADAGTVAVTYPVHAAPQVGSTNEGTFYNAMGHKLTMGQANLNYSKDFDLAFTTTTITLTNKTGASWAAGTSYVLELNAGGKPFFRNPVPPDTKRRINRVSKPDQMRFSITPDALVTNGVAASQTVTGVGTAFVLNGSLVVASVAIMDVPRCVQAAWTNTAILTITGKDEYGNTMVEKSASGTSHKGSKAFAQVTNITTNATITGATVGTTDRIGLPFFLPAYANVSRVSNDGVILPPLTILHQEIDQTRLLAGTSVYVMSPFAGYIEQAMSVITTAITTGGNLTFKIATVTVTGLTVVVADAATVGTVNTDVPTTIDGTDSTTLIPTNNAALELVMDAAFATGGALSEYVKINTQGVFIPGIRTAGGSTATTSDVRGLFKPTQVCDGDLGWEIFVSLPDGAELGIPQYAG